VLPAVPYPGEIGRAIRECGGLVLLLTPGANQSQAVLQEIELAHNEHKLIAALLVTGAAPSDDLLFSLSVRHRLVWTEAAAAAVALGSVFAVTGRAGSSHSTPPPSPVKRTCGPPLWPPSLAALAPGTVFQDGEGGPQMMRVPTGSFQMGSPPDEVGALTTRARFTR
jgi:hypothetical protein